MGQLQLWQSSKPDPGSADTLQANRGQHALPNPAEGPAAGMAAASLQGLP